MIKYFIIFAALAAMLFFNPDFSLAQPAEEASSPEEAKGEILTYMEQKDYAGALEALTRTMQGKPNYIEGYIRLAMLNYYLGNYQDSIGLLQRAADLNAFTSAEDYCAYCDGLTFSGLGISYRAIGKNSQAVEELKKALDFFNKHRSFTTAFFVEALLKEIEASKE